MKKTSRILAIDSMRGFAAIAIACVYHLATVPFVYQSGYPLTSIGILYWIYRNGSIFVELFLVISGYTSFVSYSHKIDEGLSFRKYAVRRMIRIYPLMLATLGIAAVGSVLWYWTHGNSWWIGNGSNNNLMTFVFSFLGLQMFFPGPQSWNFPSWSLSVFFVCWIFFFLILAITRNRPQMRILACVLMMLFGISLILNPPTVQIAFLNSSAARGYVSFFGGGLVYYIQQATEHSKKKSIGFSCGILLLLGILHFLGVQTGNHTIVFGGIIFPCILLLVLQVDILGKVLSFPPLVYLGKISFSIYLCNYPIEIFLALLNEQLNLQINFSSPLLFLWYIPLHIIVATVFWKIFEDIIPRKLKKKYLSNLDPT